MTEQEIDVAIMKLLGVNVVREGDFTPSTDLNDSFWAAKKLGLFGEHALICDDGIYSLIGMLEIHGEVTDHNMPVGIADGWGAYMVGQSIVGNATTPALAICNALISLGEKARECHT